MALLLKNLLFTFLVPGTVAGLLPWTIAGDATPTTGATLPLAILFFALGLAIYAWCVWDFASFGRGTPAPIDAPKRLVVRGLYRYTRNPMYVGVLTVLLGHRPDVPLVRDALRGAGAGAGVRGGVPGVQGAGRAVAAAGAAFAAGLAQIRLVTGGQRRGGPLSSPPQGRSGWSPPEV
jgi:protein-S-isoprenylcysteine O-methyltransferase Ste14